jgi:hypothetical protein
MANTGGKTSVIKRFESDRKTRRGSTSGQVQRRHRDVPDDHEVLVTGVDRPQGLYVCSGGVRLFQT